MSALDSVGGWLTNWVQADDDLFDTTARAEEPVTSPGGSYPFWGTISPLVGCGTGVIAMSQSPFQVGLLLNSDPYAEPNPNPMSISKPDPDPNGDVNSSVRARNLSRLFSTWLVSKDKLSYT